MPEPRLSPRRVAAQVKAERALELRMAGRRWREIAMTLGYADHSGAVRAVEAILRRTQAEGAELYRTLTVERLTKILQVLWPRMLAGDLPATDRVLRVLEQVRALLGLDAPQRIDMGGATVAPGVDAYQIVLAKLELMGVRLLGQGLPVITMGEEKSVEHQEGVTS